MIAALFVVVAAAVAVTAGDGAPPGTYGPPSAAIPDGALPEVVRASIDGARDWLVAHQNGDGSFGTHRSPRPIEVLCDVPGSHEAFRVATTALGVMALDQCVRPTDGSRAAASRGLDFLLAHRKVQRPSGFEFYNTWAFGYGLQSLGEWLARHPDDPRKEAILAACREMLARLPGYQDVDGGFCYLDFNVQSMPPSWSSTSFTTATVLVGLDRVRKLGLELPAKLADRAVARVLADKTPDGSFLYGRYLWEMPRMGINQRKGSACRTPGNLYALDLFGQAPRPGEYVRALEDLAIHHLRFQQIGVRRPIPHEAWYSISGYFYLYGFYYAAAVLGDKLPVAEQQRLFPHLARGVLYCRQPDGSFWDYPLYDYHYAYGSAYALLALNRAPTGWIYGSAVGGGVEAAAGGR